jgi:VanZ family protein
MNNPLPSRTHARLRTWLTTGYALFIVYASLSPFTGWRNQGLEWSAVLSMPLGMTFTSFDALANLLSYLPLGFLVALTSRARLGVAASVITGLCAGLLLSSGMEYLQMYLPTRISSNMDILSNGTGTLIGALLAVGITSHPGLFSRLTGWRSRLFRDGKEVDFGLALLALWVFGQTNPSLPMLGHVFISKIAQQPFVILPPVPFDWWESAAVTLNLLMLGTLLLTLLRMPGKAATVLLVVLSGVALAKFIAAAVLLKSWALLLWINSEAMLGMVLGMMMLLVVLGLSRHVVQVFGALTATAYIFLVNFALDSNAPSASASVYHWHYGHLLNYNGLAQTISLIFPLLLIYHLWRTRKV